MYSVEELRTYAGLAAFITDENALMHLREEPELAKEIEQFNALAAILDVSLALHQTKIPVTYLSIIQFLADRASESRGMYGMSRENIIANIEKKINKILPILLTEELLVPIGDRVGAELRITQSGQRIVNARKEATYRMNHINDSLMRH